MADKAQVRQSLARVHRPIVGRKKGGGGGASQSPDTLRSRALAQLIDLISEGEIGGLVNGAQSIFIDNVPLQNSDSTWNFEGLTLAFRSGTQGQSYISGFPDIESEITVGVEVKQAAPIVRTITDQTVNAVRVTMSVQGLYQSNSSGYITGANAKYSIAVQTNGGGYVTVLTDNISGKTEGLYERAHRIDLTGSPPWDIKVTRITPDNSSATLVNNSYWTSYTEIIDAKLCYPNSALCAVAIDSSQFDHIPTRGYLINGLIVQIPSNYDPVARTYTGVWDGTFVPAWTNNPAWCYYDLLTNPRYGLGQFIQASQVDKWALYTIGQYCDGLVDNGFGGTEPRFVCNVYLQNRTDALQCIRSISGIFRGMTYWAGGTLTSSQDSPGDPVALYTRANVIDGTFSYAGVSAKQRHTVALVTWNDPQNYYQQAVEYVEDAAAIAKYGVIETEIIALGATSRGQAWRVGQWTLLCEQMLAETLTFNVGLDGAVRTPGQIIQVADPGRSVVRFGGRVLASTAAWVMIDAPVTLVEGDAYVLSVMDANGVIEDRTVTNAPGTTATLFISSPFSTSIPQMAIWILGSTSVVPALWRVFGVSEPKKGQYAITCTPYNASIYSAVDSGTTFTANTLTSVYGTPAPPTGLVISAHIYSQGATQLTQLLFSWTPVSSVFQYEVTYQIDDDNPQTISSSTPSCEVLAAPVGDYAAYVVSISQAGVRSAPSALATLDVTGLPPPPDGLGSLSLSPAGAVAELSWAPLTQLTVTIGGSVVIRFGSSVWDNAVELVRVPGGSTSANAPLASGTYLGRTLDVFGQYSTDIAQVIYGAASGSGSDALTAAISPAILAANVVPGGSMTRSFNCLASGGLGPYSYAWSAVGTLMDGTSSTSGTVISTPGAALTSATINIGTAKTVVLTCVVTDSLGNSTNATAEVDIQPAEGDE